MLCLLCHDAPASRKVPLSDGYGYTYLCEPCLHKLVRQVPG